ncbi:dihydrofolate reductase [Flavihumibacter sp. R14]|nr:dihydrofolate reductase [Flavihumibacter soli]
MIIQIVVIVDENNGIGKDNQLLCHMPADLKHFKKHTVGHPVIMGRRTFDSIKKPLPNRRNIVVTRQDMEIEGCDVVGSIEQALALCNGEDLVSIVGGAMIFEQSMDLVNRIHLTCMHHQFEADTFFPKIDPASWKITSEEDHDADDKNPYPYSFITYERR